MESSFIAVNDTQYICRVGAVNFSLEWVHPLDLQPHFKHD